MTKEQNVLELAYEIGGFNNVPDTALKMLASLITKPLEEKIAEQQKELGDRQAKIDSLMLEYCPEDMVVCQLENWANHQAPIKPQEIGDQLKPDMSYMRNLEERCDSLQKELDSAKKQEPVAWIEHHKGGDNLSWDEIEHSYAKPSPLYTKPFSTKELDDCKDAVVMLHEALYQMVTYAACEGKGLKMADDALSATSAIVEGYKK
jgi:hypothetical protein